MENDPYTLRMTGPNAPIYHLPAHAAPHPTRCETLPYSKEDLCVLRSQCLQCLDINNALIRTCDDGLQAEVHCFHNLMDEQEQKEAEVGLLNDCIADIIGDLRRCVLCLE